MSRFPRLPHTQVVSLDRVKGRLRGDLWVAPMKSAPTSAGTVQGETDSGVRRLA